jgi:hypothetical protein
MKLHRASAAKQGSSGPLTQPERSSSEVALPLPPAACLIAIVLSSLGLWAGVWRAVKSLGWGGLW